MIRTQGLEGFAEVLDLLAKLSRDNRVVSVSINLDPTGLGHVAFKLVDGTALPGMAELAGEEDDADDAKTNDTAPGKRSARTPAPPEP